MSVDVMYVLYFLLGGIIVTLIYHFSKEKNTMMCSILPAFPTFFALGYFMLLFFGGDIKQYVKNSVKTFGIDVICLLLLSLLLLYVDSYVGFIIFLVVYILVIYYSVRFGMII